MSRIKADDCEGALEEIFRGVHPEGVRTGKHVVRGIICARTFEIRMRTVSEANAHEHWRERAKRARAQRHIARMLTASFGSGGLPPYRITITRVAKRKLDSDNLAGSQKHIRDGIADALGIDDGDETAATWHYAQRVAAKGEVTCSVVTIEWERRT